MASSLQTLRPVGFISTFIITIVTIICALIFTGKPLLNALIDTLLVLFDAVAFYVEI
jgi:hypothetical protein